MATMPGIKDSKGLLNLSSVDQNSSHLSISPQLLSSILAQLKYSIGRKLPCAILLVDRTLGYIGKQCFNLVRVVV